MSDDKKVTIEDSLMIHGDCIEEMKKMDENSVDSIVTDPPYNFDGGFMGKEWDNFGKPKQYQKWCEKWAKECLRVLKPGGHILAFSGTHSFHRLAVGLEDAGFNIKTTILWLYGQGFPKSTDISKQIDKRFLKKELTEKLGHKPTRTQFKQAWKYHREVNQIDVEKSGWKAQDKKNAEHEYRPNRYYDDEPDKIKRTAPATPEAEEWEGWGTALKPAHEPIVVAQKPKQRNKFITLNPSNIDVLTCECDNDGE